MKIKFKKITKSDKFKLPVRAHETDAGMDFIYWEDEPIEILPNSRKLVPLGFAIEIPVGFELQIRPRSGLALNYGISVLNSPGTIDCSYRGEVKAIIINTSSDKFIVESGTKICQGIIAQLPAYTISLVDELSPSDREAAGFGSSGIKAGE